MEPGWAPNRESAKTHGAGLGRRRYVLVNSSMPGLAKVGRTPVDWPERESLAA